MEKTINNYKIHIFNGKAYTNIETPAQFFDKEEKKLLDAFSDYSVVKQSASHKTVSRIDYISARYEIVGFLDVKDVELEDDEFDLF